MKKYHFLIILIIIISFSSCQNESIKVIDTDDFELIIPNNPKAVLILFPGYGGDAVLIKQESKIPQEATKNQIAVFLFNSYNHHLFLSDSNKNQLEKIIFEGIKTHHLENLNIFLGGFSSGGNVALLIANRLNPIGIFIIDSPVDLANLYFASEKKAQYRTNKKVTSEPKYLVNHLNKTLGNPNKDISQYENYSPFTSITNYTYNIHFSKDMAIRLYTEPDLKFYRQWFDNMEFSDMNSSSIQKMYNSLLKLGHQNIEYIETKNKGYRSNGDQAPHSWSIADAHEIVEWIIDKNHNN